MIDPPGDGNRQPEQFRGETSRDIYAWIQEARLFIEGTKTDNRDDLYMRGANLLRAMRFNGITTGADFADSGVPRTVNAEARDKASAASSADLPSEIDKDGLDWRTCGVIELAVRNPNVSSYMEHWEARALKAEATLAAADPALRTLSQQWRDRAVATDAFAMEPQHSEQARSNLQHLAAQMELCAADLDRLCPEIRDEPKSDPV